MLHLAFSEGRGRLKTYVCARVWLTLSTGPGWGTLWCWRWAPKHMDQPFWGQQELKYNYKINQLEWKWNHLKILSHGTKGNKGSKSHSVQYFVDCWLGWGYLPCNSQQSVVSNAVCLPNGFEKGQGKRASIYSQAGLWYTHKYYKVQYILYFNG